MTMRVPKKEIILQITFALHGIWSCGLSVPIVQAAAWRTDVTSQSSIMHGEKVGIKFATSNFQQFPDPACHLQI